VLHFTIELALAFILALSCTHNRPDAPAVPVGPSSVEVDSACIFRASASNGRQYEEYGLVWVRFDWGDGDTSPWCGHGETVECSHSWRDGGVYAVRAQAHDQRTELSEWSAPCSVIATVPSYPYRLTDSVAVGDLALFDAQVLPNGEFVYIADMLDGVLSVVRTSDLHIVTQISLNEGWWGEGDVHVMCSPNNDYVYAVPYSYCYVGVVRTSDQVVMDSLMVYGEADPISSTISPDGTRLYVAVDDYPSYVVVFRLPDNVVEDTVFAPGVYYYITSMKVAPGGSRLYAVDLGEGRVCAVRLSDDSIEWQVSGWGWSEGPGAVVVHPTGSPLYVLQERFVSVRDPGTGFLIDSIPVSSSWNADISPDGSFLYVTCGGGNDSGAVAVVQTSDNKVVRVIGMPDVVLDVAPSPDGKRLYVPAENGKLYVLSR